MLYVLVTSAIGGLQLFDIPALFNVGQGTGYVGGPNDTSTTVTMYIMRLHNTDTGRAAAVSVLLFICTLIISLIFFRVMQTSDAYGGGGKKKKGGKQSWKVISHCKIRQKPYAGRRSFGTS